MSYTDAILALKPALFIQWVKDGRVLREYRDGKLVREERVSRR